MDFTGISAIAGSLKAAADIGKTALDARDAAKLASTVAQMNDKILEAQQRLFVLGTDALALQDELARAKDEALKLKAALQERGRYVLANVTKRHLAYKFKGDPVEDGGDPVEPEHYVCQPCFDQGRKAVLLHRTSQWNHYFECPLCKVKLEF